MKPTLTTRSAFVLGMLATGATAFVAKNSLPPTSPTALEMRLQRLEDQNQVQRVMSMHAYYHGIGRNDQELAAIWSKRDDIAFGQNQGYYLGRKSFGYYYGELQRKLQQLTLNAVAKKYPEKHIDTTDPKNLAIGNMTMHMLTTPVIEVAGDGQTAKGIWYSPGFVTEVGNSGNEAANESYEKYGVDFIKEDGQWKIWHMHVYTDFFVPPGHDWTKKAGEAQVGTGTTLEASTIVFPKPDREVATYSTYDPTHVPSITPRLPVPYQTFSQTFSYANE